MIPRRGAAILTALLMQGASACAGSPTESLAVPSDPAQPDPARPSPVRRVSTARPPLAGPLAASPDEWTWIDFPDSRCANGTPTGVAVNAHRDAKHVVVFLEGGGACIDGRGCWSAPTAVNIASGYGLAQLESDEALALPIFRRDDATNPFADASYVFVPYCTGDLHAGNGVAVYDVEGTPTPTFHHGARNLDLYLQALGGAFPSVDRAWLVGQSAGGFGTLFNHDAVARALGVRTDVIDHSGPGIGATGFPSTWSVRLPPDCAYCELGLGAIFVHDRITYSASRFAFLSFRVDPVLSGFYGASEQAVIDWLGQYESTFAQFANTRSFVVAGTGHVVMRPRAATPADLTAWLGQMVADDPSWSSVTSAAR